MFENVGHPGLKALLSFEATKHQIPIEYREAMEFPAAASRFVPRVEIVAYCGREVGAASLVAGECTFEYQGPLASACGLLDDEVRVGDGADAVLVGGVAGSLLGEFYEYLAGHGRHGRARQDSTRRKIVDVVQLAWEWASNDDEFGEGVPPPRTIEMRRQQGAPTVAPTWEEMDSVINTFPEKAWQRRLAIMLRFTGLRVQQVMGLKWEDLDMTRATLVIRGELGKSRQERRGRTIPVSPHLVKIMSGWGRREGFIVITNGTGTRERAAQPRTMQTAWERSGARKMVHVGRPHHAFRKGFVSELRRAGADADAVEVLVGHSLGLRGVYTDADALPLRDAVALIPPLANAQSVIQIGSRRKCR
jgi:integrase